jgi:hypothetical protein
MAQQEEQEEIATTGTAQAVIPYTTNNAEVSPESLKQLTESGKSAQERRAKKPNDDDDEEDEDKDEDKTEDTQNK